MKSLDKRKTYIQLAKERTRQVALRRQTAVTAFALMSLIIISRSGGVNPGKGETEETPNPPTQPQLSVQVLEGDTLVHLTTDEFEGSGSDNHESTDWEIHGPINGSNDADVVWSAEASDSLLSYNPAGLDEVESQLTAGETYRAFATHNGEGGGASAVDSVEFVATFSSLTWFCDWKHPPTNPTPRYRGTTETADGIGECFNGFTAQPNSGDSLLFLNVVANPGRGFPAEMDTVLRVSMTDALTGSMMALIDSLGDGGMVPDVGGYAFFRFYHRLDLPVDSAISAHTFHTGHSLEIGRWGNENTAGEAVAADSTFRVDFTFGGAATSGPGEGKFSNGVAAARIKVYRAYRNEYRFHRFHTDSLRVRMRVYDEMGDSLLLTGADFKCQTGDCTTLGGGFQVDSLGHLPLYVPDWNVFRDLAVGNNGAGNDVTCPLCFWYFGGIAARKSSDADDWIGAYPVGQEAN